MSTSLIDKLATELEIPEGVTVTYDRPMITVQGPLGKTWKSFKKIPVTIEVTDGKVLFKAQGTRDKNRAITHLLLNFCCYGRAIFYDKYSYRPVIYYPHIHACIHHILLVI